MDQNEDNTVTAQCEESKPCLLPLQSKNQHSEPNENGTKTTYSQQPLQEESLATVTHPERNQIPDVCTKQAKNISCILGPTNDVMHFDRLRSNLHSQPGCKELIEAYTNNL